MKKKLQLVRAIMSVSSPIKFGSRVVISQHKEIWMKI